jgi:hypothetical protein
VGVAETREFLVCVLDQTPTHTHTHPQKKKKKKKKKKGKEREKRKISYPAQPPSYLAESRYQQKAHPVET